MDQTLHLRPQLQQQQQQHPQQASSRITTSSSHVVTYAQRQLGVSVSEEKRKAFSECKAMVERIAAQCRKKNRKFRDINFDVENDRNKCLHNLVHDNTFSPSDTRRITELVNKPVFYSGGLRAAEVVQGSVEDCYLVSALSGMTALPKLVEELCVARDEEVGVYGFIFYRDCYWVPVIVDDLVFTRIPRFEQLSISERELYHYDKLKFNVTARTGIDSLYFAKAGKTGDTWVPLVEKAFAKLHGDYASVMFGRTCDALEDITGGVSSLVLTKDILDIDAFWEEELLNANKDRIFACWFKAGAEVGPGKPRSTTIDGLIGNLSHSVVKAVECEGKRFVILRDPWGEAGWQGPWSDGSKEWTTEWLERLDVLGHNFSGTGQFLMEYKDFLNIWQEIQRTLVFDDSWIMSSQWLHLPEKPELAPWHYGEFAFSFSLPVASRTIISFTKVNPRFFKDIQGAYAWNMDFIVAREGETDALGESSYSFFYTRSISVELDLEPGNYVVLPRLDPSVLRDKEYFKKGLDSGWDRRKLGRILTERANSWSIAANYKPNEKLVVKSIPEILGGDLAIADKSALDALKTYGNDLKARSDESVTVTTTTTTQTVVSKRGSAEPDSLSDQRGLGGGSVESPYPPHHHHHQHHHGHPPPPPLPYRPIYDLAQSPPPQFAQQPRLPELPVHYGALPPVPMYQPYTLGQEGRRRSAESSDFGIGVTPPSPQEVLAPNHHHYHHHHQQQQASRGSSPNRHGPSLGDDSSAYRGSGAGTGIGMGIGGSTPRQPNPPPSPFPYNPRAPTPNPPRPISPTPTPLPLPLPNPLPNPYYPQIGGSMALPQFRSYSPPLMPLPVMGDRLEDDNAVVVGLKVYTRREAVVVITGRVRESGGQVRE